MSKSKNYTLIRYWASGDITKHTLPTWLSPLDTFKDFGNGSHFFFNDPFQKKNYFLKHQDLAVIEIPFLPETEHQAYHLINAANKGIDLMHLERAAISLLQS